MALYVVVPRVPTPYAAAIVIGYAAHLLGDFLTSGGIPLLWPLVRKRQGLPVLGHTGGWREHAVVVAAVAGAVYVVAAA